MDWNNIFTNIMVQSPVAAILFVMWWKAESRCEKWEDRYVTETQKMITLMTLVSEVLRK